jgi:D-sedoheptulose 7-phosphate isomerase
VAGAEAGGDKLIMTNDWFRDYFRRYEETILRTDVTPQLVALAELVEKKGKQGARFFFAGNGASASIASHAAVDFTKQVGIKAYDFNEPNFITALSNDYGYENWVGKALEFRAETGDVLVLISSSGKSPNILSAAKQAKSMGLVLVTFSGFAADNPLRLAGDINFWVDSRAYNIVECTHMIWLMAAVDYSLGKAEYDVSH